MADENTHDGSDDSVAFTFSDDGRVLALTKIDGEGGLFKRSDHDWVVVPEDDRSVFDRTMLDVEKDQIGAAIEKFDANPLDLTKSDVSEFLAPVQ